MNRQDGDKSGLGAGVYLSKADLVTAALRDRIMDGHFPPGEPLPSQRDLAEQLAVSPTPVRESLRRLESEGLIRYDAHHGSTVVDVDFGATRENFRIRAELEALAVELAIPRMTDDGIAELERIESELEAAAGDPDRVRELNREFHFRLYEISESKLLLVFLRRLWQAFPRGPQSERPVDETVNDHRDLLRALHDRDAESAARHCRLHVLGALEQDKSAQ